ncbi:hypothetical protein ABIE73_000561 [Bradyrhizobium yuanmingense]
MRWTRQRRVRELRAGRIALREPRGFVRTSGAVRFVAPAFRWQRAQRRRTLRRQRTARTAKPCGPGRRCYGQALANAALASTGAVPVTFAGVREAKGNSAPGRARHKPSDHRAGKAVCWASPVCCCAVLPACALAQRTAGAAGTRPSLRPLASEGGETKQSSGEAAARLRRHVCDPISCPGRSAASPRRCEASSGSTMRCRAGAHASEQSVWRWVPALRRNASRVAACPGHVAQCPRFIPSPPSTAPGAIAAQALDANWRRQVTTTTAAVVTNSTQGLTNQPR